MEPLHKDDIEILDYILNESRKVTSLKADMLKPLDDSNPIGDFTRNYDYKRYFEILEKWKVVNVAEGFGNNEFYIQSKPEITKRFINEGGFKKLYAEQQEKLRIENILVEKDLDEAKIIKWTKKTYKLSVIIVVLSFIISVIALIVAI